VRSGVIPCPLAGLSLLCSRINEWPSQIERGCETHLHVVPSAVAARRRASRARGGVPGRVDPRCAIGASSCRDTTPTLARNGTRHYLGRRCRQADRDRRGRLRAERGPCRSTRRSSAAPAASIDTDVGRPAGASSGFRTTASRRPLVRMVVRSTSTSPPVCCFGTTEPTVVASGARVVAPRHARTRRDRFVRTAGLTQSDAFGYTMHVTSIGVIRQPHRTARSLGGAAALMVAPGRERGGRRNPRPTHAGRWRTIDDQDGKDRSSCRINGAARIRHGRAGPDDPPDDARIIYVPVYRRAQGHPA